MRPKEIRSSFERRPEKPQRDRDGTPGAEGIESAMFYFGKINTYTPPGSDRLNKRSIEQIMRARLSSYETGTRRRDNTLPLSSTTHAWRNPRADVLSLTCRRDPSVQRRWHARSWPRRSGRSREERSKARRSWLRRVRIRRGWHLSVSGERRARSRDRMRACARARDLFAGEKSAKFLPPGRIAGSITGARTRRSVISASRAREFDDNAVPGESEWATSPPAGRLITAHCAQLCKFREEKHAPPCQSFFFIRPEDKRRNEADSGK